MFEIGFNFFVVFSFFLTMGFVWFCFQIKTVIKEIKNITGSKNAGVRIVTYAMGTCFFTMLSGLLFGIIYMSILSTEYYKAKNHHEVIWEKPDIEILYNKSNRYIYLIDNKIKEFTNKDYSDKNNIYYKIEYYKDLTNKTLTIKGK